MRHQLVPANTHSISLRERANKRNAALPPLPYPPLLPSPPLGDQLTERITSSKHPTFL